MRRSDAGWVVALILAAAFPLVVTVPYFISTAIVALMFVALAVAFDLVVGRVGALSLGQPVFLGFGAYAAAILSSQYDQPFLIVAAVSVLGSVVLASLIGIPAFRLSLHAFAIATLGFAVSAQLVANNWIEVTGGPLCVTGIGPMVIGIPPFAVTVSTLSGQYWVILVIAALSVALVLFLSRMRLGLAFTAVRDDPILAAARGLWPTEIRLIAFGIAAGISGLVGAFLAHHQRVICPDALDISYMIALLIIVFVGGRASLRGVVVAAILFTVLPQVLRLASEWRLVVYGSLLLVVVTTFPDGLEQVFQVVERAWKGVRNRIGGNRRGS